MEDRIRVLIVDDSAFARSTIAAKLATDPGIEVVGQARDGVEAVEMTLELKPGVVTMDVTMPRMDGLAALEKIMLECPTPVVMLSALTGEGTEATIRALELGAVDFFLKPSVANPAGAEESTKDLISKIRVAVSARLPRRGRGAPPGPAKQPPRKARARSTRLEKVVVIGSSTGGPQALSRLLPALPEDIPAAVLIVQHMPKGFTRSLAERLDQLSQMDVKEAQTGDLAGPGMALLAPGDYHMTIGMDGRIDLNQGPPEHGVRPSVNVTMEAVARVYGAASVGVVLTGMGSDGTRGAGLIKAAGGKVVVQDEATCSVYGMPASVVDAGKADRVLPLLKIAPEIVYLCQEKTTRGSRQRALSRG
jgi:two-component system chemotaxis response regulator CheB